MDLQLAGRVAIVTGASRGLGRAAARALVAEGAYVLAASRSADDLASLEAELPGRLHAQPCDMRERAQVAALPEQALAHFGRLDILVNNAGIAPAGRFSDMGLAIWDDVLAVNVMGPVALTRAAAPHFLRQRSGKVINVSSLSGLRGKAVLAAYSASKGALLRFTEALSGEWAPRGIQVNAIAPGGFETQAQQAVLDDPETLTRRLRKIPAGRMGDPTEFGPLVCYLASPLSNFVSGSTFIIDGGEYAKL